MKDITTNERYEAVADSIEHWDNGLLADDPSYSLPLENRACELALLATDNVRVRWARQLGFGRGMLMAELAHHIAAHTITIAIDRRLDGAGAWQLVISGYISALSESGRAA